MRRWRYEIPFLDRYVLPVNVTTCRHVGILCHMPPNSQELSTTTLTSTGQYRHYRIRTSSEAESTAIPTNHLPLLLIRCLSRSLSFSSRTAARQEYTSPRILIPPNSAGLCLLNHPCLSALAIYLLGEPSLFYIQLTYASTGAIMMQLVD